MIVDDDADVHSTTTFALGNLDMQGAAGIPARLFGRPGARTARANRHRRHPARRRDGRGDAGLHLVRYIRETLRLADLRIILRTGQPGYAPEMDAIRGYDINDYRTKSELTRTKLYTTVAAAIRSYEQIRALKPAAAA
jgi:hypothetical protein